ncbi:hypothetical protein TcasGA2_TC032871 [Tribolium castaneum]|uniref:Uncharacterized protein n=1 Tax=Tribolium castaneum TaxID=7070 RepID=A0A139WJV8_TRICA|nr:hypothetical protein TcasGA2_TC032871 [Tribolium castaneum]
MCLDFLLVLPDKSWFILECAERWIIFTMITKIKLWFFSPLLLKQLD